MHGLVLEARVPSDDLIQFGLGQFTVDVVGSHHTGSITLWLRATDLEGLHNRADGAASGFSNGLEADSDGLKHVVRTTTNVKEFSVSQFTVAVFTVVVGGGHHKGSIRFEKMR
jgi:hypothetical protein